MRPGVDHRSPSTTTIWSAMRNVENRCDISTVHHEREAGGRFDRSQPAHVGVEGELLEPELEVLGRHRSGSR
jgi:hypothetical protein